MTPTSCKDTTGGSGPFETPSCHDPKWPSSDVEPAHRHYPLTYLLARCGRRQWRSSAWWLYPCSTDGTPSVPCASSPSPWLYSPWCLCRALRLDYRVWLQIPLFVQSSVPRVWALGSPCPWPHHLPQDEASASPRTWHRPHSTHAHERAVAGPGVVCTLGWTGHCLYRWSGGSGQERDGA